MKKMYSLLLVLLLLAGLLGCAASQVHSCTAPCQTCGLCLNADCPEEECGPKCAGP